MKKSATYIITAVLCIGAVVAGCFAFNHYKTNRDPSQTKQWQKIATSVAQTKGLEQTDIENIFFSLDENKYYHFADNKFSEYISEIHNVGLDFFGNKIQFDLNLINVDGKFFGFAKYDENGTFYFIKATNVPDSSSYDKATNCLLLFDKAKAGTQGERLYEESFVFDLTKNVVRGRYIADRYRAVEEDGGKRDDYAMLTTEMLEKAAANRVHFLTRSFYVPTDDPYRVTDINTMATGYTAASTLTDVILNYAYDTDGGIFHFKRGENKFYSMLGTGTPADTVLCTFEGDYVKDYVRQGDYLVNVSKAGEGLFSVTNAVTGERKDFTFDKGFTKLDSVTMNKEKTRLVLTGEWEHTNKNGTYTLQNIAMINLENKEVEQFVGVDMFDAGKHPCFVGKQLILEHGSTTVMPKFK